MICTAHVVGSWKLYGIFVLYLSVCTLCGIYYLGKIGALLLVLGFCILYSYAGASVCTVQQEVSAAYVFGKRILSAAPDGIYKQRTNVTYKAALVSYFGLVAECLTKGANGACIPLLIVTAPARKTDLCMA